MNSTPSLPLSIRLREGTRESHRQAENTPFIRELFAARLPLETYRIFLTQLYQIYTALETNATIFQEESFLKPLYLPQLFRRRALERDLDFYFGSKSWQKIDPFQATYTYKQRIEFTSREWPLGLVAHHYTRYLGDLSGGQAMKRIVAKMYHLDSENGLAFFNFPQISDYATFKNEYRARLDALPIDDTTAQKVVAEANYAFELNRQIFAAMMEHIVF